MKISDRINEVWERLEPFIEYDEYGEYLKSLEIVARYGNEEESPELYKLILKELETAYEEIYEEPPTELPVCVSVTIQLGKKPIGFTNQDAEKELINMGFDVTKFNYWYIKQGY